MSNALLMSRPPSGIFKTMDEQLTQLVTAVQQHAGVIITGSLTRPEEVYLASQVITS